MRLGDVRFDEQVPSTGDDTVEVTATFHRAPIAVGPALLHVRAQIEGTTITDEATTVIDATDNRLAVLFFDPRASWLSTFVRRAVERDPRFAVTHRVVTSRNVSNTGGPAPVSLRDPQSLSPYGTIVVGSPEQLSGADVSGLEAFMRERGGRVVLLMDRRTAGPIDRLTGASGWRAVRLPSVASLNERFTGSLQFAGPAIRAREIAWPATLPTGASMHNVSYARDSTRRAVVWSVPVGAGRLFVSGALDAWQYREGEATLTPNGASGFGPFWTSTIAGLTTSAPPAVEVTLANRSIAPGQAAALKVWIRDAALSKENDRLATASAVIAGPRDTANLRLWPDIATGTFTGTVIAPREPGVYRIIASSGVERSEASLVVDPAAREPTGSDERHLIDAFASSRGGSVVAEKDLANLPGRVSSAIQSALRVETWHPMRSAWWIVPFALLLGAEWWWRRRRGLP
jgi:hypothetical protein